MKCTVKVSANFPSIQIERRKQALRVDLFLTGSNAITKSGKLVNLDIVVNRVAGIMFGPKNPSQIHFWASVCWIFFSNELSRCCRSDIPFIQLPLFHHLLCNSIPCQLYNKRRRRYGCIDRKNAARHRFEAGKEPHKGVRTLYCRL